MSAPLSCALALLAAATLATAPALSQTQGAKTKPQSASQSERAACMSRPAGDARQTCLREMGAAQVEARRGGLTAPGDADYERNSLARCEVHKTTEDRAMCERLMKEGTVSGSVEGGGIYRELTIREAGTAPAN